MKRVLCAALLACAAPVHADILGAERTGILSVAITFSGDGSWQHPTNGAFAQLKFSRELAYTMALRGVYVPAESAQSAARESERILVVHPVAVMGAAGATCGRGGASIFDESRGMAAGATGQLALVPFTQQIRGGGPYPSKDTSVPQPDLCATKLTFDDVRHTLTLHFDGTDAQVRVVNTYNGHKSPAYNLRLQGDAADVRSRFVFTQQIPAGALAAQGAKVIAKVSTIAGPGGSVFPLSATVKWRVEMK